MPEKVKIRKGDATLTVSRKAFDTIYTGKGFALAGDMQTPGKAAGSTGVDGGAGVEAATGGKSLPAKASKAGKKKAAKKTASKKAASNKAGQHTDIASADPKGVVGGE